MARTVSLIPSKSSHDTLTFLPLRGGSMGGPALNGSWFMTRQEGCSVTSIFRLWRGIQLLPGSVESSSWKPAPMLWGSPRGPWRDTCEELGPLPPQLRLSCQLPVRWGRHLGSRFHNTQSSHLSWSVWKNTSLPIMPCPICRCMSPINYCFILSHYM